jgi:hypothetical protein
MTPHKATESEWKYVRRWGDAVASVLLEIADRVAALEEAATPPPPPAADHSRGATEMVATDEELLNAFHGNCIGGAPRLCAVYNLGRQHAAQPRQKQQPLPPPAPVTANPAAIGRFGEWLAREMPPGTEIGQPLHWAPRIVFAVLNACQEVEPTPPPAPAGDPVAVPSGLVERVLSQLPSGTDPVFARHAILETADWADEEGYIATARVLQEVAIRSITHPTNPPALAGGLVEELAQLLANRISAMPPGADCTPLARTVLCVVADAAEKMVPDPNLTWERVAIWLDVESEQ